MRLSPLLLVAGAGAVTSVLASAHDQSSGHHLEARDPFSLSHGGHSAGVMGRGFPLSLKKAACPRSFKCNGSGTDGYQLDIYGNGPPSWVPSSGWAYFGVAIGWAPTASFDCSASFKLPSIFLDVCDQVTWWSPSAAWKSAHLSVDLGIDIPSFWDFRQTGSSLPQSSSKNVACPRSGTDGYQLDIYGNGPPSWVPSSGWAYFGIAIGWAPTAAFDCSAAFTLPSAFVEVADQVTWWSPSAAWKQAHLEVNVEVDLGFTIPSFWDLTPHPSSSWKCSGSGKDGWSVDIYGNGPPSWVPASGWAYFGVAIGWAPTASFDCSASFTLPSAFVEVADQVTWWSPSAAWKSAHLSIDLGFDIPSFWNFRQTGSSLPQSSSKNVACPRSGTDGYQLDIYGNGPPSWVPSSGWAYFGIAIGWAPTASFDCSASFTLPSAFVEVADQVTWWSPSAAWKQAHLDVNVEVDLGFTIPSFWNLTPRPSSSWKCSGSGKDGWSVDIYGNGPPSWVPASGWGYFGQSVGWAPFAGWSCSSSWSIPSQWEGSCGKVTWWSPPTAWITQHKGHSFGWSVPSFWFGSSSSSSSVAVKATSPLAVVTKATACSVKASSIINKAASTSLSLKDSTSAHPASTTSHKATTTSKKAASSSTVHASSSTTHKVSTTTHKVTTTTHKVATTTAKSSTTTHHASTTSHKASSSSTSHKASSSSTSHKASTTSKKPVAASSASHKATTTSLRVVTTSVKPTMVRASTATVTVTGSGTTEYFTVTVTQTGASVAPSATKLPGKTWTSNGSGTDGWEVDWQGNGCPSYYPSGWLWFGAGIGWAPPSGWVCPMSWSPSSLEISVSVSVSWWLPPVGWKLPSGVSCPSSWTAAGWIDTRIPSASFQCDGSGMDGFDFDFEGNARPSGFEVGFKWFGKAEGWQPCAWFELPSAYWVAPVGWNVRLGTWWKPTGIWYLKGEFECPKFWSKNFLRGSFLWW
ncbi:hypothetical protein JCM1840_007478 [Sporobolomyces johnsonii]